MINKSRFVKIIRELRNSASLSQNKFASLIGVTGQAVSKWENGHSLPDIDMLPLIANALNTTIDYLLIDNYTKSETNTIIKPCILTGYDVTDQEIKLLTAISDVMPREKMYKVARLFERKELKLNLNINLEHTMNDIKEIKEISINKLSDNVLLELAKPLATIISNTISLESYGINEIIKLLECPKCGCDLEYLNDQLTCSNKHIFNVIDGVVDFGYREDLGNNWSYSFKNFNQFYECHKDKNPSLNKEVSRSTLKELIKKFKEVKPKIFIDAGTGEGMGFRELIKEIDWPCIAVLTDLSHRILWYNKMLIDELHSNPFVTIVYLACNLKEIPFKDNVIDCIWSFSGLISMGNDYKNGINECYRILNKGGQLLYDIPTIHKNELKTFNQWTEILVSKYPNFNALQLVKDIKSYESWNRFHKTIGFSNYNYTNISKIKRLPIDLVFPYDNELLQWVGTGVAEVTK